ncbi:MAG TPA: hypothetical protein VN495_03870, partial [Candidatus Paceibacterota bacterium]|nr:hypothetical protein [Candidatus Paceibacterota bacterium]
MFRDIGRDLFQNALSVFKPRFLPWHALAILLTAIIVLSDTDWHFFLATRPYTYYWLVFGAGIG